MKQPDNKSFDDKINRLKKMGDEMVSIIKSCGQCDVLPDGSLLYRKKKLSRIIRRRLNERS